MWALREAYQQVEVRIKQIDFEKIWPRFHPAAFALFDEEYACLEGDLVVKPEPFYANTAQEYKGKCYALWHLTAADTDADLLTANIIHEMFHAFQMEQGEQRWGDDLKAMLHPLEEKELLLKYTENQLLAAEHGDPQSLQQCARLRDYRKTIAQEAVAYECAIEAIEGMAEYAGLKALQQMMPEKYQQQVQRHIANLRQIEGISDPRKLAYSSGVVWMLAAEKAKVEIHHRIGAERRSLYEIIQSGLQDDVPQRIQAHINQISDRQQALIQKVLACSKVQTGKFEIRGYDPMNLFRQGKYIYGSHFWVLWEQDQQKTLSISGESVLECDESGQIVKVYGQ